MKRMKIWTSLILAVWMVLSMLPISVAAETQTQSIPNAGLGDWYVPDWTDKIVMTDEGDSLAFTYDRSQVSWVYFAAPVTVAGVGAGGTFSFTMDLGAERGYSDNFLVRLMYADDTTYEAWPAAQEGKAEYTVIVPQDAASTVREVQIYPENPYSSYESQTVTVRLYGASLRKKMSNEGLGDWYSSDWKLAMTDGGADLAFTYDRSQVSWVYFAAPAAIEGVGAGGTFSFTLDFGAERGYTDNFLVRFIYADDTTYEAWPAAQEGKAEYTVTVPQDATSTVKEVQIYPENPWNTCDSQTVTVKLYGASLRGKMSNEGLGDWYSSDWKLAMTDEGADLAFTYDRSQVSWVYFAAPAALEGVGAGGTFSFTLDFGTERGYTDNFLVRFIYADDTTYEAWPAAQEGKAEYTVSVPQDATSTVREVQIYPENPWNTCDSKTVTVKLYQAKLSAPMAFEGLNTLYYPSWWGEEGSWANDPINISTENPAYMLLSYTNRKASATDWKCVVAEPAITASAGATLTLDVEFEPERTGGNFLVRFNADDVWYESYVGITGKRGTYTVTVPDSVQGTVSEIRIHPENPWANDLPEEASAMKLYSVVFAAKEDPGQLDGHSLTLNDNVSVNFYMDLNDSFLQSEGAALKVTVDDTTTSLPIPEANENGQYVFRVEVAASQMTAPVTVQLVSNDITGEVWSYSVLEYANELLSGSYSDEAKALVRAMLDYGGKAQSYFGYRTDALANADLTDLPSSTMPESTAYEVAVSGSVTGLNLYGASLLFKSRVAIRYYFTLSGDNAITDYQFTVGSQECTPVQNEDGLYYVEVTDITPQLMDAGYTVTAAKADGSESLQVTYSCMSYITRMYAKQTASEGLKTLVKAMYEYSLAAKGYLNSI